MARYGLDFYDGSGSTKYGELSGLTFDTRPFVVRPHDHRAIFLSWNRPDTGSTSSNIRLVRNSYGYPSTPSDGSVLLEGNVLTTPTTYVDENLAAGRFYYYSLFATDTSNKWQPSGRGYALSTRDWKMKEGLWELLPTPYKLQHLLNSSSGEDNDQLYRFISLFGFQLDVYRTEIELLYKIHDVDTMKEVLVALLLNQLGLTYEPAVGLSRNRALLKNATAIYKYRGTKTGIRKYITSLTGWDCDFSNGINLLLDRNDSSFEESLGRWYAKTRCSVSRYVSDGTVSAYLESNSPANFPNLTKALMRITVDSGTGNSVVALPQVALAKEIPAFAVPVDSGVSYTANCRMRKDAAASNRNASVTIVFYDKDGLETGRTTGSTVSISSSSDWSAVPTVTATSPTNTLWAGIEINIVNPSSSEKFYVDAVQLGEAAFITSTYEDARLTNIRLFPDRQNYIITPAFHDGSVHGWVSSTGTLTVDSTDGISNPTVTHCLKTTAAVSNPVYTNSSTYTDVSDSEFIASAYVKVSANSTVTLSQIWEGGSTASTTASVPANTWTRISVCSVNDGTGGFKLSIGATGTVTLKIDGILMEQGNVLQPYFDGISRTFGAYSDAFWTGTAYESLSLYYSNRTAKFHRLSTTLRKYVPQGSDYKLTFTPSP